MSSIHPMGVLAAFVVLQVIGFAWYHEGLFGTAWLTDVGLDPNNVVPPPAWVWIVMMGSTLLKIYFIALFLQALRVSSWLMGLAWGAALGLGLIAMTLASHNAFAMRPVRQILIEGSQETVGCAIAGAILVATFRNKSAAPETPR